MTSARPESGEPEGDPDSVVTEFWLLTARLLLLISFCGLHGREAYKLMCKAFLSPSLGKSGPWG